MGVFAMADGWREFLSAWKEFRVEADEYRELDRAGVTGLGRATSTERGLPSDHCHSGERLVNQLLGGPIGASAGFQYASHRMTLPLRSSNTCARTCDVS